MNNRLRIISFANERLIILLVFLIGITAVSGCRGAKSPIDQSIQSDSTSTLIHPTPMLSYTSWADGLVDAGQTPFVNTPKPGRFVPDVWDYISDDFESGSLALWKEISPSDITLTTGGYGGSPGLSIAVNKRFTYIYKTDIVKSTEGYLTFWFNPNNVNIPDDVQSPIPAKSIRIADIKGMEQYDVVAALRIWKPNTSSQGYKAYLEWQEDDGVHYNFDSGQFDLVNGWQKITLGFCVNNWVGVWVNDVLMSDVTGIQHSESSGEIIEIGKTNDDIEVTPNGSLLFDDIAFQIPVISDFWVDAVNGKDENSGLDKNAAFRTIQRAADLAGPGTKVHILPGVYRESIDPAVDGLSKQTIEYVSDEGPGTVIVRGSESSKKLSWQQLQSNTIGLPEGIDFSHIYSTDLSEWKLAGAPRFLMEVDDQGNAVARLPLAREPDELVKTQWKYSEFWWAADGGSKKAGCDPASNTDPNCDYASRSMTQLTDAANDKTPQGIEPGNLSTLGDLTGATLVAIDTFQGHYVYRRTITSHELSTGRITVDRKCEHDNGSGNPGLGWGTKYYVEGKPSLLDSPGEWWYDGKTGRLYLWSPHATSPSNLNIEISRLENGFRLSHRSNIAIDGITYEFFNGSAIYGYNEDDKKSANNIVRNVKLQYANHGVYLYQSVGETPDNITSAFLLEQSEIAYMDSDAINLYYYWKNESAPDSFTFAGITNTTIHRNKMHHLSFRSDSDSAKGVAIQFGDHLRFEENHVSNTAHNGVQFSYSIIQSGKTYSFSPDKIKTGDILVKDNVFEQACEVTTDCGALKFWGDPPDTHVYRDVLITGNVFRNSYGWSSVSEARKRWNGGSESQIKGMGGFGLYLDMVSGIHVFRNIFYNNAYAGISINGVWRDGVMILSNNIFANSLYGVLFGGLSFDTHKSVNTQVINNIIVNNEADGIWFLDTGKFTGGVTIDHDLYFNNGWLKFEQGGVLQPGAMIIRKGEDTYQSFNSVSDIQTNTPWESHGLEGNPGFTRFDLSNHNLFTDSSPDFHISNASTNVIDRGTEQLPESLVMLLDKFDVTNSLTGLAFDIGRYEWTGQP